MKPNLARWFWGSIIFMATLSILLSVMAMLHQGADTSVAVPDEYVPAERSPIEVSAFELENRLGVANHAAADAVRLQIGPMLDAAYQPAYDAVPKYADYHYSVWGEYAELGTAAIGDVGAKLEEMLFSGLEPRLESVAVKLDEVFSSTYQAEMEKELTRIEVSGTMLGPLTENAIGSAQRRMLVTVPVGTAAITGTKAIAAIIAKKIATKLATKAALKAGGKWAVVGTTAGGAAALCSWSGPGAGLCAAAGGIGAWLVADYGIVKLDEYWNREEFEAELREMITEQKFANQVALENAVTARALAVQEMTDAVVEQHDFTLRELSGVGNAEICRIAMELVSRYDLMRANLGERTLEALKALRAGAAEEAGNLSIGRLAQEIIHNLNDVEQMTVTSVQIKGNLPQDQRADRDVSGRLVINGNSIEIPQASSDENDGFVIVLDSEVNLIAGEPLDYAIALEQHLRIWGHRYFGGQGQSQITTAGKEAGGLEHWINLSMQISYNEYADSLDEVSTNSVSGEPLSLIFRLRAPSLPALQKMPECQ
ncbi:MAG: hypothetical protein P8Q48_20575 [Paracoccaceae bacterium]|nr:hypothetical protein [Paracoccaceae bacterium]